MSVEYAVRKVGAVIIGRNEGERLQLCLQSLLKQVVGLVYVDSGSTDNSLLIAESLGVSILNLDMSKPFTAARSRNAGYEKLKQLWPSIEYVQFIDGDCEVVKGWMEAARSKLDENEKISVVCGRRRERFPKKTIYNRLCDIEWDTPVGEADACGGDVLVRTSAFEQVGGYNSTLIAGEEPEMCVRLRKEGWKVLRIDAEMTMHDANMFRFSQWWRRAVRAGHAYAEGAAMHGETAEKHCVKQVRSNWFWGMSFPVLICAAIIWPQTLFLFLFYFLQMIRIYRQACLHRSNGERWLYAVFCVMAKLPLMFGQLKFKFNTIRGRKSRLIEYK